MDVQKIWAVTWLSNLLIYILFKIYSHLRRSHKEIKFINIQIDDVYLWTFQG